MTKPIKLSSLPEFDITLYLDSDEAIADYLNAVIEDGDSSLLAAALGDIARARGLTEIAHVSGLTREALYKALKPNAKPRFETINKVCNALGVRMHVEPIAKSSL
jgi:probable addiction module antidote protein